MQTYTKPQKRDNSSDLFNLFLQMSSLEERKKYTKIQADYAAMAKKELGMKEEVFEAGKTIRKEAALTAKGRTEIKKDVLQTYRTDKAIAEAQRKYDNAKQYGNLAAQASSAKVLSELKKSRKDVPMLVEWAFMAEEKGKEQTAQMQLQRQQVFQLDAMSKNLGVQLDTLKLQQAQKDALIGDTLSVIEGFTEGITAADALLTMNLAYAGDKAGVYSSLRSMGQKVVTGKGKDKVTGEIPKLQFKADVAAYEPSSISAIRAAAAGGATPPDTMSVELYDEMGIFDWARDKSRHIVFTMDKIKTLGLESKIRPDGTLRISDSDYDSILKGTYKTESKSQTVPVKKKTVKEIVSDKATKVTPAGTKTAKKPAGEKVRVVSPNGATGWIPREQLEDAIKQGYKRVE